MFEALRGLRDAVAPESGNLGGASQGDGDSAEPDYEDLYNSYRSGDPATVALVNKINGGVPPTRRDDFIRLYPRYEMEKDSELVHKLAETVLEKSDEINQRVSSLPGMHRTRKQQMEYVEKLLEQNRKAAADLEERYATAKEKRDQVRRFIKENTCKALGIMEG